MNFQFCPHCGNGVESVISEGYKRWYCSRCDKKIYRNPTIGVAVILFEEGKLLLVRRAKGVSYEGQWCIPCGYVEWDEDVRAAAVREFAEETGLEVTTGRVIATHSNFHNPKQHTVGTWFAGEVAGGELAPIDGEFSELGYFDPAEPPPLAFPTDALVLEQLAGEWSGR